MRNVVSGTLALVFAALVGPVAAQDAAFIAAGEAVYAENCSVCHGAGLVPIAGKPDLTKLRPNQHDYFVTAVLNGRAPEMPEWRGVITDEQIEQIWAYVQAN